MRRRSGVGSWPFRSSNCTESIGSGAERIEVEALDRFDLVVEEIDANGEADLVAGFREFAGEVDVDDPAAHGEIAGDFDLIEPVVAMLGEPDDQLLRLPRSGRL